MSRRSLLTAAIGEVIPPMWPSGVRIANFTTSQTMAKVSYDSGANWQNASTNQVYASGYAPFQKDVAWDGKRGIAVMVGAHGSIQTCSSSNFLSWTSRFGDGYSGDENNSVAFSPKLDRFVVVGRRGTSPAIYYSPIGNPNGTWTRMFVSGSYPLYRVVWAAKWNLFIASGSRTIHTSPDGVTWTIRYTAAATMTGYVNYDHPGGRAICHEYNNRSLVSTDGITWTVQLSGSTYPSSYASWSTLTSSLGRVMVSNYSGGYRSSDWGATFAYQGLVSGGGSVLRYMRSLNGLLAFDSSIAYNTPRPVSISTDGGASWTTSTSIIPESGYQSGYTWLYDGTPAGMEWSPQ